MLTQMTEILLRAEFRPGEDTTVGRMALITPDLCGKPLTTSINGHEVRLRFPERPTDALLQPGYNGGRGEPDHLEAVHPMFFRAEMTWSLQRSGEDAERKSRAEAVDTLRAGATRLSDALRFAHPPTGLAGNAPETIKLTAIDVESQEEVVVPVPRNPSHPMIVGLPAAGAEIVERVLAGQLQVPETLLAQAAYWIRSTPDPKHGLGVVLVAMACETKVRQVLSEAVSDEMEPLLIVLFERHNIFQTSAKELFGYIADAVLGRSIRADDNKLFSQVGKLFDLRNKMAHRGVEPTRSEAWQMVLTGYSVFEWLRQFEPIGEPS
jgi:hypothetical protein